MTISHARKLQSSRGARVISSVHYYYTHTKLLLFFTWFLCAFLLLHINQLVRPRHPHTQSKYFLIYINYCAITTSSLRTAEKKIPDKVMNTTKKTCPTDEEIKNEREICRARNRSISGSVDNNNNNNCYYLLFREIAVTVTQ